MTGKTENTNLFKKLRELWQKRAKDFTNLLKKLKENKEEAEKVLRKRKEWDELLERKVKIIELPLYDITEKVCYAIDIDVTDDNVVLKKPWIITKDKDEEYKVTKITANICEDNAPLKRTVFLKIDTLKGDTQYSFTILPKDSLKTMILLLYNPHILDIIIEKLKEEDKKAEEAIERIKKIATFINLATS